MKYRVIVREVRLHQLDIDANTAEEAMRLAQVSGLELGELLATETVEFDAVSVGRET